MRKPLPSKLGIEFWFSLMMIGLSVPFAYFAIQMESGRNLFGSVLVASIFAWRLYDRVRKVRLFRLLSNDAEMKRIYESWNEN